MYYVYISSLALSRDDLLTFCTHVTGRSFPSISIQYILRNNGAKPILFGYTALFLQFCNYSSLIQCIVQLYTCTRSEKKCWRCFLTYFSYISFYIHILYILSLDACLFGQNCNNNKIMVKCMGNSIKNANALFFFKFT